MTPGAIPCRGLGTAMMGGLSVRAVAGLPGGGFRNGFAHCITAQRPAAARIDVAETALVVMDIGAGNYIGVACLIMTARTGRGPAKIGWSVAAMVGCKPVVIMAANTAGICCSCLTVGNGTVNLALGRLTVLGLGCCIIPVAEFTLVSHHRAVPVFVVQGIHISLACKAACSCLTDVRVVAGMAGGADQVGRRVGTPGNGTAVMVRAGIMAYPTVAVRTIR